MEMDERVWPASGDFTRIEAEVGRGGVEVAEEAEAEAESNEPAALLGREPDGAGVD